MAGLIKQLVLLSQVRNIQLTWNTQFDTIIKPCVYKLYSRPHAVRLTMHLWSSGLYLVGNFAFSTFIPCSKWATMIQSLYMYLVSLLQCFHVGSPGKIGNRQLEMSLCKLLALDCSRWPNLVRATAYLLLPGSGHLSCKAHDCIINNEM